ncbi:hypothetical protein BJ944DRAFT_260852 [Cunninghamella echinulata]|nr:hypothetical protein BJ944DRAFT_260852 [Cunninghamella echinulata]
MMSDKAGEGDDKSNSLLLSSEDVFIIFLRCFGLLLWCKSSSSSVLSSVWFIIIPSTIHSFLFKIKSIYINV